VISSIIKKYVICDEELLLKYFIYLLFKYVSYDWNG